MRLEGLDVGRGPDQRNPGVNVWPPIDVDYRANFRLRHSQIPPEAGEIQPDPGSSRPTSDAAFEDKRRNANQGRLPDLAGSRP